MPRAKPDITKSVKTVANMIFMTGFLSSTRVRYADRPAGRAECVEPGPFEVRQFESRAMHRSREDFLEIDLELCQVLFGTLDGAVLLDHLVAEFLVGVKLTQSD